MYFSIDVSFNYDVLIFLFFSDSFNAVRGLETVTFCLAVFTLILLIIYMCADFARKQTMAAVIMVLLYIAGNVLIIIIPFVNL